MHVYSDISHFRAPYRNWAVHGFGQTPDQIAEVSAVGADGVRRYNSGWRDTILGMLNGYKTTFITSTQVKVTPFSQAEIQQASQSAEAAAFLESLRADLWVAQKVSEGYAVMVPFSFLFDQAGALASETGLQLGATPASDKASMKAASDFPSPDAPLGAYVAEPGSMPKPGLSVKTSQAGLTPLLWAAGVIAILGGGAYYLSKKSRGRVGGRTVPQRL